MTVTSSPPRETPVVPGPSSRAAAVIGDVLSGLAVVFTVPFVILAVGMPIALCLRLVLWVVGML